MAKRTVTLSADTTGTFLASVRRRKDATNYIANFLIYGTFGGGTVSLYFSPDHGVTLIPITDSTTTAITATSNLSIGPLPIGNPSTNSDSLKIYVGLSGSTNPSLKVDMYDNN